MLFERLGGLFPTRVFPSTVHCFWASTDEHDHPVCTTFQGRGGIPVWVGCMQQCARAHDAPTLVGWRGAPSHSSQDFELATTPPGLRSARPLSTGAARWRRQRRIGGCCSCSSLRGVSCTAHQALTDCAVIQAPTSGQASSGCK